MRWWLVLVCLAPTVAAARVPLAVTIDDLPFVGEPPPGMTHAEAVDAIVGALRRHSVPATGFVVCRRFDDPMVRQWASALPLGNHTTTHRSLNDLSVRAWRRDVSRCQERLDSIGATRWFRFPFLQRGPTTRKRDAAMRVLRDLGLRAAPVSIDTSDWAIASGYASASEGERRHRGRLFVEHLRAAHRHYRQVGREAASREVAHVMLLHANALVAEHLDAALDALEADGARFVSLEDALRDPVYAQADRYAGPVGLSWLYRIGPDPEEPWRRFDRASLRRLRAEMREIPRE